jgi:uncharacterized membrane protein
MHITVLAAHIIAGGLAIIFGFIALFALKGAPVHRRFGRWFVLAMIAMGLIGSTMSIVWNHDPEANAPMGVLCAYLVATALTAVRPPRANGRRLDAGLMLVALAVSLMMLGFGVALLTGATGRSRVLAFPLLIFFTIAASGLVGDARMIRAGGSAALRGVPRIYRHLWRMTTALLIAVMSFFLGQAKVIPKPIRIVPLLMIPPLVVLAALLYWIWRVRMRRSLRGIGAGGYAVVTAGNRLPGTGVA